MNIKGKAGKADILVGICSRPPNQDEEADNYSIKCWLMFRGCQPLFWWRSLACWMSAGSNTVERRQSEGLLECVENVEENFWLMWNEPKFSVLRMWKRISGSVAEQPTKGGPCCPCCLQTERGCWKMWWSEPSRAQ